MEEISKISVIGAGAWGTALAQVCSQDNRDITIWCREERLAEEINTLHSNKLYLGDISLNPSINATSSLEIALKAQILLIVTPAQATRNILEQMKPLIRPDHLLVLCSKGVEVSSEKLMSQVVQDILPNTKLAILSGPNFAKEIAQGKPAATTLACEDKKVGKTIQNLIATPYFRPYLTDDIIGAQIAGAFKNVIAIACGIAHGLNLGESARASLVTRGLAEISRLGVSMGARAETFMGLCGVGDLMLTCSSEQSRNFSLGLLLAQGQSLESIMKRSGSSLSEGVHTALTALNLAEKHRIEMPISMAVYNCLHGDLSLDEAMKEMLNRKIKEELDF
ncbi:MAG: NAD(P)-dependent glycerol-3-phosphate dehydrogenase [Alphaproteobacteria bacterium]|nr:NAD(P)-dependent glycerol-3-phosphate dehydrogenase [Alphaproteobacteria bacterium]